MAVTIPVQANQVEVLLHRQMQFANESRRSRKPQGEPQKLVAVAVAVAVALPEVVVPEVVSQAVASRVVDAQAVANLCTTRELTRKRTYDGSMRNT